uniref:Integrase catalytic domain-containing protein n=1 Tax=Schizaphis graminum TaxID=13262 RepID=A0A2S2P3M3_SCHGA
MSLVRQKYWVVHGRSIIRKVLHDCVKCYRFRQVKTHQLMANLTAFRVNYAPVFSHCGVDFAGPFSTKPSVGRSRIAYKTYLALFICLTTKTVHLEIVSELSADTFIVTLKRFIARRGYPTKMYSDNGTNFTSTHHKLHEVYKLLCSQQLNSAMNAFCLPREIDLHFIPPASPHFDGIWEANIKSCKRIFQRITFNSLIINF